MAKPKLVMDYTGSMDSISIGDCITGTLTTGAWDGTFAGNTLNWEKAWYESSYQLGDGAIVLHGDEFCGLGIKESNMRGLFIVYVVNGVKGEVIWTTTPFVADNAEKAKMKAAQEGTKGLDLDDLDFVVLRLGDVRPKERVKEVKVVS